MSGWVEARFGNRARRQIEQTAIEAGISVLQAEDTEGQADAATADAQDGVRDDGRIEIGIGRSRLVADRSGALWHEAERTLLVADLHLEKASRYAARGQFLPPYDTAATLLKLDALLLRYRPQRLICLGDSFHDVRALERMAPTDSDGILALSRALHLVWISGNHDPDMPEWLPGERAAHVVLAGVHLCHEPSVEARPGGEICGHLHPAARVSTPRGSLRRRCFASDGGRIVMPAFGALTGGLNVRDEAFHAVFGCCPPVVYVLGLSRVYAVAATHLFPDEKRERRRFVRLPSRIAP